ncbi:MAG: hypothetical protein KDB27_10695 [Planctomycetales bacterium]|nr:hypothetical protein [Planctomycetales bacterium]
MYVLSVTARCLGAASLPIVVLLMFLRPAWVQRIGEKLLAVLQRIGKHPIGFGCAAVAATFILNAAISCFSFWPIPSVHDEFAYVLTGDTFANGRLTNPTHPFSNHFTSWHIFQTPSYQAKYPPAQGVVLAIGQKLFGFQLAGVWLSIALAMAAVIWAMFQWLRPRWAVYGSLLILLNPHIHLRWGQSYWGGAVALAGGALLIGAFGRLRRRPDLITGIAAGSGLAILAASRPFEGLLMAIPVCCFTAFVIIRSLDRAKLAVVLGSVATLTVGGLSLTTYNQSVTGNWKKMPYRVWLEQQGDALDRIITPSVIPLQHVSKPSPETSAAIASDSAEWRVSEMARMMAERKADSFNFKRHKLTDLHEFYLQTLLRLPLLAVPWLFRDRYRAVLIAAVVVVFLGSCTHLSAGHPHYIAGAAVALIVIVTFSVREITAARILGKRVGSTFPAAVLFLWTAMSVLTFAADFIEQPRAPRLDWAFRRTEIARQLAKPDSQQVLFVEYTDDHNIHQEWVYNGSDIDRQSVIWANSLSDDENRQLLRYLRENATKNGFSSVQAWEIFVGDEVSDLRPYLRDDKSRDGV